MSPRRRGRRARRREPAPTGPRARDRAPAERDRGPPGRRDRSRADDAPRHPRKRTNTCRGPSGAVSSSRQGRRGARGDHDGPGEVGGVRELRPHRARRPADLDGHVWSRGESRASLDVDRGKLVRRCPRGHLNARRGRSRGARGVGRRQDDLVHARDREGVARRDALADASVAEAPPEGQGTALGVDRRQRRRGSRARRPARGPAAGMQRPAARWQEPRWRGLRTPAAPTATNSHASVRHLTADHPPSASPDRRVAHGRALQLRRPAPTTRTAPERLAKPPESDVEAKRNGGGGI